MRAEGKLPTDFDGVSNEPEAEVHPLYKTKIKKRPNVMDSMMSGQAPEDDDEEEGHRLREKEDEKDEFLYENYLKTGGYLGLKRKAQSTEELEEELLDED